MTNNLAWDDPQLKVPSDGSGSRRARYRLLQSWYRETHLGAPYGEHRGKPVGSLLGKDAVSLNRGLNFIGDSAGPYAEERAPVVKAEGGSIETGRLFHNMLSSMPLCFSIFGELRDWADGGLSVVQELFDSEAVEIERMECEWKPEQNLLGDRTAFDAVVVTRRADDTRHLIGIETKYTETFSQKAYPLTEAYKSVQEKSGWFREGLGEGLTASSTNQLWRNALLAASCEQQGYDSAAVCVLALEDDDGARRAIDGVRAEMRESERRCLDVTLQQLTSTMEKSSDRGHAWGEQFRLRYLDLSPVV